MNDGHTTDPQRDLGAELDRRAQRRDAWYGLKCYVHQNGPLLGFDAEGTKHDPSSGQFTGGGGGPSGAPPSHNEAHRKANYHEAQARMYKGNAEKASSPADKKRAEEMVAHHESQGSAMRKKGEADGPAQKKPGTPQVAPPRGREKPFTPLPGMDPGRAKAIAGGAMMNPREVAQLKHREQYPNGMGPLRNRVKKS